MRGDDGQVLALVDGQNLRQSLNELGMRGIDFAGLRGWLSAYGYPTIEWFQGAYESLRSLFNAARASGIRVHAKLPKPVTGGGWKADADVDLCVWAMEHAADFSSVVLVSGDGDFEPLVEWLIRQKKRVVLVQSPQQMAPELLQHVDPHDFIDLESLVREVGIPRREAANARSLRPSPSHAPRSRTADAKHAVGA